ncbi:MULTISPECIES: hypothetical protein [unclassified Wolbachia]|nr:hypothetical protein [Wolbachia endosymbiont (group A) of Apoderus coryli]
MSFQCSCDVFQCLTLLSFVIPVLRHWDPVFHMIPSRTLYFT